MTQSNEMKPTDQYKDKSNDPKQIEGEIGQTREAITNDIRALGEKLTPAALKAEAKDALVDVKDAAIDKAIEVKDAAVDKVREVAEVAVEKAKDVRDAAAHTITETAHEVSEKVEEVGIAARRAGSATWHFMRANALPLSILGVGAGLLLANNLPSRRSQRRPYRIAEAYTPFGRTATYEQSSVYGADYPRTAGSIEPNPSRAEQRSLPADSGSSMSNGGSSLARRVSTRTQGAIQHAGERAQHMMHDAAERVQHGASQARHRVVETYETARRTSTELVQGHPLAVGATLLAIGIGLGTLLPSISSRREKRRSGGTRDRVMEHARIPAQGYGEVPREMAKPAM